MELQEALRRRKMVRSFRREPVPDDVIDQVLASVVHAPSAGYTQGNEFLVLTSEDAVADYVQITEHPDYPLTDADREVLPPVVVIPLSNESAYVDRYSQPDKIEFGLDAAERWAVPYWDVDAGMASMLILLVAVECGLGALFAGIFYGEAELLSPLRRSGALPSDRRHPPRLPDGGRRSVGHLFRAQTGAPRRRPTRPPQQVVRRGGA